MSDALNYLIRVRPEAMTAYFTFLKQSGKSLDPKTRALITLITKVMTQTEGGFRQYLGRALQAGCTPDEILDALLHAFPGLGLTKIVWAIDLLLAMDLPAFQPENLGAQGHWHMIKPIKEFADGRVTRCEIDDRGLFVYRAGGEFRVYDSHCPHQATNIPELALDGLRLTCPKHQWAFDVASGECVANGNRPLHRLESKVENDALYVHW
jgi:nitrite reductase/ring-hydroxylating ferredoxin subunit